MLVLILWMFAAVAVEAPPVAPSPSKDTPSAVPPKETAATHEAKPESLTLQPALISVAAKQGGTMSFNDQEPSKLLGGVRMGYEEALVLCDHVHYWQSKLPGLKRATLDHALFASGPEAEEPEHVVFDTRHCKMPQIAFRGLMHPREVEIIRQPLDPKDKTHVRFRVLLHQLGDFAGDLQTANGWAPHFGWADETELLVIGDLVPGGIANPRFATVILHGRPVSTGVDKRPARLGRKHIELAEASVKKELGAEAYDWWAESSLIRIEFDDQGRMSKVETGSDYRGEGVPSLDTPVHPAEPVQPQDPGVSPKTIAPKVP